MVVVVCRGEDPELREREREANGFGGEREL